MNALPIKNTHSPHDVIDDLIADFGIKPVLLAIAGRLFRKRPAKVASDFPNLQNQPGVEHLSDHLRTDLGLPPGDRSKPFVDPIMLMRKDFF